MKLYLAYRDDPLGEAWRHQFGNQADVEIVNTDITTISCDAIVSPANSFGFMDGGLDLALSERFGWELQTLLQEEIAALPERELLVGRSIVVQTNDAQTPWLISAPTMRVPMSFNIGTSVNAYLAMKAILIAGTSHPEIKSIAIPGLCTGVGRMPPKIASIQMFAAYDEILLGKTNKFEDFGEAQKFHAELNLDGLIWDF